MALWGLIGVALLLVEGSLEVFDVDNFEILPVTIQEMVFAMWLIVKGLNDSVRSLGTARPAHGGENAVSVTSIFPGFRNNVD